MPSAEPKPNQEHVQAGAELCRYEEDVLRLRGKKTTLQIRPNSEGPRRTPAIISPATCGCPRKRPRSEPTIRQTRKMIELRASASVALAA